MSLSSQDLQITQSWRHFLFVVFLTSFWSPWWATLAWWYWFQKSTFTHRCISSGKLRFCGFLLCLCQTPKMLRNFFWKQNDFLHECMAQSLFPLHCWDCRLLSWQQWLMIVMWPSANHCSTTPWCQRKLCIQMTMGAWHSRKPAFHDSCRSSI